MNAMRTKCCQIVVVSPSGGQGTLRDNVLRRTQRGDSFARFAKGKVFSMNKPIAVTTFIAVFLAGAGIGFAAGRKPTQDLYHGKSPKEAAAALADVAIAQAGKNGSWERIGIGRAYYLGGMKAEGEALFNPLLSGKRDDGDLYRIARVYAEAGDWDKAKPLFEDYLSRNPEEENDLAEVGAYFLLNGDRARAEELFDRALAVNDDEVWVSINMAAGYLGVRPQ